MLIRNLKKFSALIGLTSFVLLSGCRNNDVEINSDFKVLNEKSVDKLNDKLDRINAIYDYQDRYITENDLNLFVRMDKYEKDCNVILVSDDIDTLVRGLIPRIEIFSKYVSEKYTASSDLYVLDNYSSPYKYGDKSFYKILYDIFTKMFENEDKENWNNLYCKLANTAIVFSDNHIINDKNTGQTENLDIRDYELEIPVIGNVITISENNIDKLAVENYAFNPDGNYEEIFMNLFYDALSHELEHCNQNNCSCYYSDYIYLNYVARLLNYEYTVLKTDFLAETGAVYNGNIYHETDEFLNKNGLYTGYDEEIETTKLVESAILLRDDYNVNDIYDNSVSSNPKKLCDWFNVDIIKVGDETSYDDYAKLFNMLTVLNASNSHNQNVFDWIVEKKYGSTNNMNAKKMMMRSDAVTDIMIYSYKNLIAFNEKNNLSYDAFNYLVEKYQNYYLSKSEFVNAFDGLSYWSNEFRIKYEVANDVINEYVKIKYNDKNDNLKDDMKVITELKNKLGDKYNVFISNIGIVDNNIKDKYNEENRCLDDIANVKVRVVTK